MNDADSCHNELLISHSILRFDMINQQLTFRRLPIIFATGLLSTGLLLSGCSKSDNDIKDKDLVAVDTTESQPTVNDANSIDDVDGNTDKTDANKKVATDTEIVSEAISPIAAAVKEPSILTNQTQVGTPENTVKLALDTLYYGDIEKAATYYKVDMENFAEELKNTQFAFKQTVEAVTIIDTKYNGDKTKATVIGELRLKGQKQPAPLTYELQKINGEWKILG